MSVQAKARAVLSARQIERYKREVAAAKAEMRGEITPSEGRKGESGVVISERRRQFLSQFNRPEVAPNHSGRIRRLERVIANGSPDSLSRGAKVLLEKELAGLKSWLSGRMVPKRFHSIGYGHPDFQKAVNQCLQETTPEFQSKADRFKSVMRELAPDDPDGASLERIRPEQI